MAPFFKLLTLILCLSLILLSGCASGHLQSPLDTHWDADHEEISENTALYNGVVRTSRYLNMRDGIMIAVDLYLPENIAPGDKLPTLLLQTRYWRDFDFRFPFDHLMKMPKELSTLVESGYAIVRIDARGTGASFGNRQCPWSKDEIKDGAEVVDWIVNQSWSNHKVGAVGGSYEGTAAELLLVNKHPAVKAVAPLFSLYDVYTDIAYPGGIHLEWFTRVWQKNNRHMDLNEPGKLAWYAPWFIWGVTPVDDDPKREMLAEASKDHLINYDVHQEALRIDYRDDISPIGFTPDAFSPHAFKKDLEASGAAIYSVSGWMDGGYAHSAIKRYLTLSNPKSKLLIGPWDHGGDDHYRPFAKPVHAKFDLVFELKRFFDYHLKGIDTGLYDEPPVHYYTMGADRWNAAQSWPPKSTPTTFYLESNNGLLLQSPENKQGKDVYKVDPSHTTGKKARWNSLALAMAVQYPDRKKQDKKLLIYETPPLESAMEVTGHPFVSIHAAFSQADGLLFVYLEDVNYQGEVSYVTEGKLRAIYRKLSKETPPYKSPAPYRTFLKKDGQPVIPGQPIEMTFDLEPTSYLFAKSHKIRIAIAGVDANHFETLPGQDQTIEIYRDRLHPSHIVFPVVK